MRLILFDVDGTLIDSQAVIHEAMRLTFRRWGSPEPQINDTRSVVGLTLETAIATLLGRLPDGDIAEMADDYRDLYVQLNQRSELQSAPYAGVCALLDRLSRRSGVRLGIVTGKSRRGVAAMLATRQFRDRFDVARCADDCPSKPHPAMVLECCDEVDISPLRTLVVGDTSFDIEMALAARATALGVAWGYHGEERIRQAGAHGVAASIHVLETMIDEWLTAPGPDATHDTGPAIFQSRMLQYA